MLSALVRGKFPQVEWRLKEKTRNFIYFLVDGIYPNFKFFINAKDCITEKEVYFQKLQEAVRKDVERLFGVLKIKWGILNMPTKLWAKEDINLIVQCCAILHNLIIRRGGGYIDGFEGPAPEQTEKVEIVRVVRLPNCETFEQFLAQFEEHQTADNSLRQDLIDYNWELRGDRRGNSL
jgi:hypothetical protein